MADLDPEFQALLGPATDAAPAAPAAATSSGLDPDFHALLAPAQDAPKAVTKWLPSSLGEFAKDMGNNTVRAGAKALWALPGMAEDFGVGVRNVIAGKDKNGNYPYELPSATFNQALDQATTAPTTTTGKVGEAISSILMGSKLGGPTYQPGAGGMPIPNNFAPTSQPLTTAQQSLADVRNAGYVVPPSTGKSSVFNKVIESIGGKTGTEQDAAAANMGVTDNLVRKALGMAPDAEITPKALADIRKTASAAKDAVVTRSGAAVNLDKPYADAIDQITAPYKQAASELGDEFGNPGLVKAADAINKAQITPAVAVKAITQLRDKASVAFRQGDNTTGAAYKALATNLEDGIDRHLTATGNQSVVDAYRAARQLQAKTFDVEDALNADTGHVNANVLKRADYLSGDLATAAKAASLMPKATKEVLDSGPVRNTDIITGGLAAVMKKEPAFLLYPMLRAGVRAGMLSNTGQRAMLGPIAQAPTMLAQPNAPQGLMGGTIPQLFGQWNLQNQRP